MRHSAHSITASLVAGLALSAGASAQLIAYDGFDNGPLANLGGSNGGTGWTGPWQDLFSSLVASVGGPGLTYPGLDTRPGAAVAPAGNLPDMMEYLRAVPAPAGNTLYVSMLIRPESPFSNWHMVRLGNWPLQVDLGVPIGYYHYGLTIGDSWIVASPTPTVAGETALLVLEIQVEPAAGRTLYSLYVNPTIGAPKPGFSSASFARQYVIPLTSGIETRGLGGFTFDELRLGTTWESVLPAAAPPCYANCDGSTIAPVLNVNDFICFQSRFAAADPYADCTHDAAFNVNDFVCFQAQFVAGCR